MGALVSITHQYQPSHLFRFVIFRIATEVSLVCSLQKIGKNRNFQERCENLPPWPVDKIRRAHPPPQIQPIEAADAMSRIAHTAW